MNILVAITVGNSNYVDDIVPEVHDHILDENLSDYVTHEDTVLISIQL